MTVQFSRLSTPHGRSEFVDDAAAVVDKGCYMETVWLICVEESGKWVPRQDLPPAFDEEIARRFAAEQTILSERLHRARPFRCPPSPENSKQTKESFISHGHR